MLIIRLEMQGMRGHDSIVIDIITFFVIVLIFFIHVSKVTFDPIEMQPIRSNAYHHDCW